jgi:hypothetical protein
VRGVHWGGCSPAMSFLGRCSPPPPPPWWMGRHPLRCCQPCLCPSCAVVRPMPQARHAVSGEALTRETETPHRSQHSCTLWAQYVGRGWSKPHLGLSGLLALLLLHDLCSHAVRRLSLLRYVLPSRLLCACGGLEVSEHLRHLMATVSDAELEGCLSVTRVRAAMSAPSCTNTLIASTCLMLVAWCSAVAPPSSLASLSTPICTNTVTAPTCPLTAA